MAQNLLTTVYATDEDILTRISGDYVPITPSFQRKAAGSDGIFASNAPWVLNSASVDFQAQQVSAGDVCQLISPAPAFTAAGDILVVDSVAGNALTLRRPDQATGVGQPPGPASGVTGARFVVLTLYPQIEDAAYEINDRFGIDPNIPHKAPANVYDQRQLRQATVLTVLSRQYAAMSRNAGTAADDFWTKSQFYKSELDIVLDRLSLRWGSALDATETSPPTGRFSTRIVR